VAHILPPEVLAALSPVGSARCDLIDPDDFSRDSPAVLDSAEIILDDAGSLVRLLSDENSWWFAKKRCLPSGTAIVEFNSPLGQSRLWIGVRCSDRVLHFGNKEYWGIYDPVRNEVVEILKRVFPTIASPGPRSMWKRGAIAKLKQARTTTDGIET
jgi:hypothetical protein